MKYAFYSYHFTFHPKYVGTRKLTRLALEKELEIEYVKSEIWDYENFYMIQYKDKNGFIFCTDRYSSHFKCDIIKDSDIIGNIKKLRQLLEKFE